MTMVKDLGMVIRDRALREGPIVDWMLRSKAAPLPQRGGQRRRAVRFSSSELIEHRSSAGGFWSSSSSEHGEAALQSAYQHLHADGAEQQAHQPTDHLFLQFPQGPA
jgi:exopolyphosphatase/pppGpp-phosphohydrolase